MTGCLPGASGVVVIALLALSDDGAPGYDHEVAAALAALGCRHLPAPPDRLTEVLYRWEATSVASVFSACSWLPPLRSA
jgi:hypothetical protein